MVKRCNKLSINESKTELVIFRSSHVKIPTNFFIKINNSKIFPCKYVKYVGVLIDEHLGWDEHIETLCEMRQKLSQTVGILSRLRIVILFLKNLVSQFTMQYFTHT